jgi:N-acetylmuramoyl-L-alanine amidase
MNQLCALVIGHQKTSPGQKIKNVTEFSFNEDLARRIEKKVKNTAIQRVYFHRSGKIAKVIDDLKPGFVVDLRCSVNNKTASGTEVLYYRRSDKGRQMAEILQNNLVALLGLPNRGIQPKTVLDREGSQLRAARVPYVIARPFFIDNIVDLATALEDMDGLATAYAQSIDKIAQIV